MRGNKCSILLRVLRFRSPKWIVIGCWLLYYYLGRVDQHQGLIHIAFVFTLKKSKPVSVDQLIGCVFMTTPTGPTVPHNRFHFLWFIHSAQLFLIPPIQSSLFGFYLHICSQAGPPQWVGRLIGIVKKLVNKTVSNCLFRRHKLQPASMIFTFPTFANFDQHYLDFII